MANWYDDNKLVAGLSNALVEAEVFEEASDVTEFLRRPFKYNEHYDAWEAAGFPEDDNDDGWEDFVAAVGSDDSSEDEDETGEG